jgi:2,4-dienoyl-CoA reductase-like NADH-dependent reductase (Old Yellow Enzyme family)
MIGLRLRSGKWGESARKHAARTARGVERLDIFDATLQRSSMSRLFTPYQLRELSLRNRIVVSPMCQYSSPNGLATPWHMVHLGSRAIGGAGLVFTEATAVVPEGRISPYDLGLWSDAHREALRPIAAFIREHGAAPGIQLAHAGRKASTAAPWQGGGAVDAANGGWEILAPSALPFSERTATPREMSVNDIEALPELFARAAQRALEAGFEVVELHAAHGYLIHEFLSPLSNQRSDAYGGSFENRIRSPLAVAKALRAVWPNRLPVFVRISASDWVEGGWDLPESIRFARALAELGIDLIDCSSGGSVPHAVVPATPGYQVPFAEAIKREAQIPTGAVGLITEATQAEEILLRDQADLIFLARAMLRDPYWPVHAAQALGVQITLPVQYERSRVRPANAKRS